MGGEVKSPPGGDTIPGMGNRGNLLSLALLAGLAAGCGPVGPEVRLSPDALAWRAQWVGAYPVIVSTKAVPASTGALPEGVVKATTETAGKEVGDALLAALAARSEVPLQQVVFTGSGSGSRASKLAEQYLSARTVDPGLAAKAGADTGAEAILLAAVLRYGPEVEGELQTMAKGANTTVGTSQVAISTSVSRAVTYFNVQFRCALVRTEDGAILWDASVRRRERRVSVMEITQESVLRESVTQVVDTFPWAKPALPAARKGAPAGGSGGGAEPSNEIYIDPWERKPPPKAR